MSMEISVKQRQEVRLHGVPGDAVGGRGEVGGGAPAAARGDAGRRDPGRGGADAPAEWRDRVLIGITASLHDGPGDGREQALEDDPSPSVWSGCGVRSEGPSPQASNGPRAQRN